MKVSIMLTSYNLVDYIDTSIKSVIDLEKPCDWELLIGDDGSTDGTVEKIQAWIEKYPENIKLYQIPRDSGSVKLGSRAAYNRAYLLEQATGDYLNYLDGDDCYLGTERLKVQIEHLERPEYAQCSCCGHNIEAYVIPANRRYRMTRGNITQQVFTKQEYVGRRLYFHTNTIVFRKECKTMLLDSLYRCYLNDVFITFILLQYGSILYIPEAWCQYNMTGTGLWTGHSKVYGYFRNVQIYDLESSICPELESAIMDKYFKEFLYINKHYKAEQIKEIQPLFKNAPEDVFKASTSFFKLEGRTRSENKIKRQVLWEAHMAQLKFLFKSVLRKLKLAK